jgi:thymidine phosphorylase
MTRRQDAETLMECLCATGRQAGLRVTALLTDMDQPLGAAIGNAVEVREVLDALDGQGPADLVEVTMALGAEMLVLAGIAPTTAAAEDALRRLLRDGSARDFFRLNLERQGGDGRVLDEPDRLGRARVVQTVRSAAAGFVVDIDPLQLGETVVELGGGRRQPGDAIDPLVGIVLQKQRGDAVQIDEPLAEVHAGSLAAAAAASARVAGAVRIGSERTRRGPLVLARLGSPGAAGG